MWFLYEKLGGENVWSERRYYCRKCKRPFDARIEGVQTIAGAKIPIIPAIDEMEKHLKEAHGIE